MSGLDRIIARLNEECEAQCDGIAAEAAAKAGEIIARAQNEGNETIKTYEADAEKAARQIVTRAESAAAMESRRAVLETKTGLVEKVLAEAKRRLAEAPAEAYFTALLTLVKKNVQPGEGRLFLSEGDLARLPADFAARLPAGVTLEKTSAGIENGFLLKYSDVEINGALDALFSAAKEELKLKAAQLLFAE